MEMQTRFYLVNGDCLETTANFDEILKELGAGHGFNYTYFTLDRDGREVMIPWSAVSYVKNIDNRYDQLMKHCGEKSEFGVAADFVKNVPHSWGFPQTDSVKIVDEWLRACQDRFPADLQYLYKRIAYTLLAYWRNTPDGPEMDETMEAMDKVADEVRGKEWKDMAYYYEEPKEARQVDVKELIKFLHSKMPMIEREQHEREG